MSAVPKNILSLVTANANVDRFETGEVRGPRISPLDGDAVADEQHVEWTLVDQEGPRFKIDPLAPGVLWMRNESPETFKMGLFSACCLMSEAQEFLESLPEADQIGLN